MADATTYEIEGRSVRTPVGVRDAQAASATFVVPAATVGVWLPEGLTHVPAGPGRAFLLLTCVHYRDNDLGEYREVSIAVAARRGLRTGTYIHRLPVDDEFSMAAGRGIWGFPKTVEKLDVSPETDGVTGEWTSDAGQVLRLQVDVQGTRSMPATAQRAFSVIDGTLHETRFLMRASQFGVRRGGATLELGTGDAADELRRLGLPKAPLFSMAMGRMQARFDAPARLR
jgi:hypothetical protein